MHLLSFRFQNDRAMRLYHPKAWILKLSKPIARRPSTANLKTLGRQDAAGGATVSQFLLGGNLNQCEIACSGNAKSLGAIMMAIILGCAFRTDGPFKGTFTFATPRSPNVTQIEIGFRFERFEITPFTLLRHVATQNCRRTH